MKKLLIGLLVLVLVIPMCFGLTACDNGKGKGDEDGNNAATITSISEFATAFRNNSANASIQIGEQTYSFYNEKLRMSSDIIDWVFVNEEISDYYFTEYSSPLDLEWTKASGNNYVLNDNAKINVDGEQIKFKAGSTAILSQDNVIINSTLTFDKDVETAFTFTIGGVEPITITDEYNFTSILDFATAYHESNNVSYLARTVSTSRNYTVYSFYDDQMIACNFRAGELLRINIYDDQGRLSYWKGSLKENENWYYDNETVDNSEQWWHDDDFLLPLTVPLTFDWTRTSGNTFALAHDEILWEKDLEDYDRVSERLKAGSTAVLNENSVTINGTIVFHSSLNAEDTEYQYSWTFIIGRQTIQLPPNAIHNPYLWMNPELRWTEEYTCDANGNADFANAPDVSDRLADLAGKDSGYQIEVGGSIILPALIGYKPSLNNDVFTNDLDYQLFLFRYDDEGNRSDYYIYWSSGLHTGDPYLNGTTWKHNETFSITFDESAFSRYGLLEQWWGQPIIGKYEIMVRAYCPNNNISEQLLYSFEVVEPAN